MEPEGSLPCSQENPPLVPILSLIYVFHTIPPYLSKIHSNIVNPPTPDPNLYRPIKYNFFTAVGLHCS
jgi:hypothetical protein